MPDDNNFEPESLLPITYYLSPITYHLSPIVKSALICADDVGVADGEQPFAFLLHPDVCVAAVDGFARVRRAARRDERFASHDDDHIFVKQKSFRFAHERRIIDHAAANHLETWELPRHWHEDENLWQLESGALRAMWSAKS